MSRALSPNAVTIAFRLITTIRRWCIDFIYEYSRYYLFIRTELGSVHRNARVTCYDVRVVIAHPSPLQYCVSSVVNGRRFSNCRVYLSRKMTERNILCTCALRLSVLIGLLSVVVTIIYYTPIPDFGNYNILYAVRV